MALQGTLKDFGVGEILQLIGTQTKTGSLTLKRRGETMILLFDAGQVVGLQHSGSASRKRLRLGEMLVAAGLTDEATVIEAETRAEKEGRPLGEVLHAEGRIPESDLFEFGSLETREALYDLFTWDSGSYAFEAGDVEYERGQLHPISVEDLLLEGLRRTDEWPLIRRRIPSYDLTFAAGQPSERSGAVDPTLRRVLELAKPTVSVWEIVARSRLGEFETCRALLSLLETGHLILFGRAKKASRRGKIAPSTRVRGRSLLAGLGQALFGLVIVGTLFFTFRYADLNLAFFFQESSSGRIPRIEARALLSAAQMERVRSAIEIYRLERGEYPETLDALVSASLLSDTDTKFPFDTPYGYRREPPGRYLLVRPIF